MGVGVGVGIGVGVVRVGRHLADVDRVVGESLTRWRGYLVECIAEAQRDGKVRADADPEALVAAAKGRRGRKA